MRFSALLIGLFALYPSSTAGDALDEPFTSSFAKLSHAPCVSLFHRNGRVGCGTEDRNKQVGQLKYFDGTLPNTEQPYVAVLEDFDLTAQSIDTLLAARGDLLQGILVLNSTSSATSSADVTKTMRSPDSQTPRGYGTPSESLNYGYYSYPWNAKGEGLFDYDLYGVPMALVLESDVSDSLRKEAQSSGADHSIVAEFNYYMGQDGINSKQCLAWKDAATGDWSPKCLPLGGTSVWATAGSNPQWKKKSSSSSSSSNQNERPVVMLAAGMDSTSMFHDATPGANTAASNILTILMAAKLIGSNVDDQTLDGLPSCILFGLFQGETYGFIGSRAFLRDVAYPGFQCAHALVPSVARLGEKSDYTCLYPLRPNLAFTQVGAINGIISIDQVGHLVGDEVLYVHADDNNDNYGSFIASVMKYSSTSKVSVSSASVSSSGYGYPYPPSPLTSLLKLSGGSSGGAVLTGYDYAFTNKVPYHSYRDSADAVTLKSIAAAATIVARTALAAAYDDGSYDYSTSSSYAKNLIPELSYDDETLQELADCLLYNGDCNLLKQYSSVEMANDNVRTGLGLGSGVPLGTPPNYYVGVYNYMYGQPFVQVGDNIYGAYEGKHYGNKSSDAIGMIPRQLESAIHGLFSDFLGRGSDMSAKYQSCKKISDCANIEYCASMYDTATCTGGGQCVCKRAHYHIALDEALVAVPNKPTGFFNISQYDQEVSAMYTEPFWSNNVGVRVYRDVGSLPGFLTLGAGLAVGVSSMFMVFVMRVGLKKEKLY